MLYISGGFQMLKPNQSEMVVFVTEVKSKQQTKQPHCTIWNVAQFSQTFFIVQETFRSPWCNWKFRSATKQARLVIEHCVFQQSFSYFHRKEDNSLQIENNLVVHKRALLFMEMFQITNHTTQIPFFWPRRTFFIFPVLPDLHFFTQLIAVYYVTAVYYVNLWNKQDTRWILILAFVAVLLKVFIRKCLLLDLFLNRSKLMEIARMSVISYGNTPLHTNPRSPKPPFVWPCLHVDASADALIVSFAAAQAEVTQQSPSWGALRDFSPSCKGDLCP